MGTSPTMIWGRELKTSVKLSMGPEASDKGEKARTCPAQETTWLLCLKMVGMARGWEGVGERVQPPWKESRKVVLSTLLHAIASVFLEQPI